MALPTLSNSVYAVGMPRKRTPPSSDNEPEYYAKRASPSSGNRPEYHATGRPDTTFVPLADGTLFPESVDLNVVVKDDDSTTVVRVSLGVSAGRPITTEVAIHLLDEHLNVVGLTPTTLHHLNFGKIFDAAVEQAGFMGIGFKNPVRDKDALLNAAHQAKALARKRQPFSDDLLAQIATIVKRNPYDPRKEVAATLHMSDRTASRWIAEVRRRGLLDETDGERE